MLSRLPRALVLAGALALAGGAGPVIAHQPAMVSTAPRQVKAGKRGLYGSVRASVGGYGRKGAGVSMASQQRASRKARNVARSRGRRK